VKDILDAPRRSLVWIVVVAVVLGLALFVRGLQNDSKSDDAVKDLNIQHRVPPQK
jgi:hypothetical protein